MTYLFDGSYFGFLCCVYESFEMKEGQTKIVRETEFQPGFFDQHRTIITQNDKAERVLKGIKKQVGNSNTLLFFNAFLSENIDVLNASFRILIEIFKGNKDVLENYGNADVLFFHQTLKSVSRERHRMKAFIRFNKASDGLYTALIEPDFNVLPLVLSFFKKRYADQPWLIYDVKRKYGYYYNKTFIEEVRLENIDSDTLNKSLTTNVSFDEQDALFENLWKQYFKSTNIVERKNMKLHLQHVPKRYWKYLPEKK